MARPREKWERVARRVLRKARKTGPIEWRTYWRTKPLEKNVVFYESFAGNGMLCNPEAIFRYLLSASDQQHLHHIWAIDDPTLHRSAVDEFANDPRVQFVRYRSAAYFRALTTAGFLINNATFPAEFSKRPGQIYLNTWHGTPLKTMGYDEEQGAQAARNVLRNFVSADYLLSSSDYMTEQMYENAYRLRNIYQGKIIQEGYPRTDRAHLSPDSRQILFARLLDAGVDLSPDRKIVLYAPTWRGASFHEPTNDAILLRQRVRALRAHLPSDWQVLIKVHQQVYPFAMAESDLRSVLVPNDFPANEILGITDVLISDYSSIFFDFLSTGRPIIFFSPDVDIYAATRGIYLDLEELPGPVTNTIADLAEHIVAIGSDNMMDPLRTHSEQYRAAAARFASRDDGAVTERVVDIVMRNKDNGYESRDTSRDGRESILIHLGGMRSNGITSSVLNLLDNIDHTRFDISVAHTCSRNRDKLRNIGLINSQVRCFPRVGEFHAGLRHRRSRIHVLRGVEGGASIEMRAVNRMFRDEWTRCFGESVFDYIVDFSGYAPFWSLLLAQGQARTHSIWLHNDLKSDQVREVNGKRPHERNLGAVFSTYPLYENLVSVSPALSDINASRLAAEAGRARFTSARNTINYERVRSLARGATGRGDDADADAGWIRGHDLPGSVETLLNFFDLASLRTELNRRDTIARVVPPRPGITTFVTVGRLSPEKNHQRLLRAFDLVHQQNPRTRLIIVGSGPLMASLVTSTQLLGLGDAVTFAGQQQNPYAIMAQSDCFVLSSDYEGQPVVILEARVLGLPIVSTAFDSVRGALPDGVGVVVPRDHEALAAGMQQAITGDVPNPPFDPVAYNETVMGEFYRAIGADRATAGS